MRCRDTLAPVRVSKDQAKGYLTEKMGVILYKSVSLKARLLCYQLDISPAIVYLAIGYIP